MAKRPGRKRRRRGRRVLPVGLALLIAYGCATFIPPKSFKQVKTPRGGRAMNGKVAVVYSKHYQMRLQSRFIGIGDLINLGGPERMHPFDIRKYSKIYLNLITDGLLKPEDVFVPEAVSRDELLRVHTAEYLQSLTDPKKVAEYLEAPLVALAPGKLVDAGILNAFRHAAGGTILAGRLALTHGIAINLGGGLHHAKPDRGEGFCVYNDLAVAIRTLRDEGLIKRAAVVDLDVHQGNGTAVIFAGDDSVFTFSMHQGDIYPVPKENSDLDVVLPAGTGDDAYLRQLRKHLPDVLARARPDIVFLQAGADVLDGDPLAGLRLTPRGIVRRDAEVIDACAARGIPLAVCLGGGYSEKAWQVQYRSVRRTIEKYGLGGGPPHPRRRPTPKEKFYTK